MDRVQAWQLLNEWVTNPALVRHCLSVEKAMIHYARMGGHDELTWGLAGLLHDFDYERYPAVPEHSRAGAQALRALGVDEEVVGAILAHADWNLDEYPRDRPIRRTLYAVDELCGLIYAVALVRPQRLTDLSPGSVRKKMKQPAFAAGVNRQDILNGAELLGVELDAHIEQCIAAMSAAADELGLSPAAS